MISSKMKQLHEAKNIHDVFDLVSWKTLQKLAVLPFLLFSLTPVLYLLQNLIQSDTMEMTVYSANQFSWKLAAGLFAFSLVKALLEKRINKAFFKANIPLYFFAVFILLILLSTYVNRHSEYALGENWRFESFTSFIIYVAVYFGCGAMIKEQSIKMFAFRVLQIVSLILIALVVVDIHFHKIMPFHDFRPDMGDQRHFSCVFTHFNFYGYYLTVCSMLSAALFVFGSSKKWRIFDLCCMLINFWILMRIDTLGCFIAGLFGLTFLIIIYKLRYGCIKKIVFVPLAAYLVLFAVCSLIFSGLMDSFFGLFGDVKKIVANDADAGEAGTGRWKLWTHTAKYISERPWLGFGNEGIAARLWDDTHVSRPHNEYLQYAVFFGIPALIMYLSGVFGVFLRGLKRRKVLDCATVAAFVAAFAYLVSATFGNTTCSVAPYFFCLLGLAYNPCKAKAKEDTAEEQKPDEPVQEQPQTE